MYVDISKRTAPNGKTYTRALLRDSYRENGKVKHHTIANLSSCSEHEIEAIRLALSNKHDLANVKSLTQSLKITEGMSVGAVWLLYSIARELGIAQALGSSPDGKRALWQVIARIIDQGSRLSAVRLAQTHAACDILDMESFDENGLYSNLDWLCEHQAQIEDRLFRKSFPSTPPQLYLYDVTSTYLEGQCNELAAFGYNRDKKTGKLQLVVGLLCDEEGMPLTIEVFHGNLQDPKTVASQVRKIATRFGGGQVTFVGDRGMIKSKEIESLLDHDFHYITAITKPQIEKLLKDNVLQMSLFDEDLSEVITDDGQRYILRRNPFRAQEIQATREQKLRAVRRCLEKKNQYLQKHPKASPEVALRDLRAYCDKLKLSGWIEVDHHDRELILSTNLQGLKTINKLDGCDVLKTSLSIQHAAKEIIHERYKDLKLVEWAFRESKVSFLELRPVNVRKESRTRGHVFVIMLAYLVIRVLRKRWSEINQTVEEGIHELCQLCAHDILIDGRVKMRQVAIPRLSTQRLLDRAHVTMPNVIRDKGIQVATRVKLNKRRKTN